MRKLYFSGTWRSNKLLDGSRNKLEKNTPKTKNRYQKKQIPNTLAIKLIIKSILC